MECVLHRLKLVVLLLGANSANAGMMSGFYCFASMGSCVCNADQLREAVARADGPITTTIRMCRQAIITLDKPIELYNTNIQLECPGSLFPLLPGHCTIEGENTARLFQGNNSVLSINNVRLQKGSALSKDDPDGGAIQLAQSSLHLINCLFRDNTALAGAGGAINLSGGTLTAGDCKFESNFAQDGAAIATGQTDSSIHSSTFVNNQSGAGGTWIILGGSTTIESSSFRENSLHTAEDRVGLESSYLCRSISLILQLETHWSALSISGEGFT